MAANIPSLNEIQSNWWPPSECLSLERPIVDSIAAAVRNNRPVSTNKASALEPEWLQIGPPSQLLSAATISPASLFGSLPRLLPIKLHPTQPATCSS